MIELTNKRINCDITRESDFGTITGNVEIKDSAISNLNFNITAENGDLVCYTYYSENDGKANRNINGVDTDKQSGVSDLLDTLISEIKSEINK
jgi:hypothetical protein